MFYIWHTLLIVLFLVISFVLGYKLGQKKLIKLKINKDYKK